MPLPFGRPTSAYMLELKDVAAKAMVLFNYLNGQPNSLPDNFPGEQIQMLCGGLAGLPDGTAEGSITPLTQAHARLPSWRTDYLQFDDIETPEALEDMPIARRGDFLDTQMIELYSAVGSAIEVYNRLSGTEFTSNIEPELIAPLNTEFGRDASLRAIEKIEKLSDDTAEIFKNSNLPETEQTETIGRLVQDAENQAISVKSELQQVMPRSRLLTSAAKGFEDTAFALDQVATIAEVIVDVVGGVGGAAIDVFAALAKEGLQGLLVLLREVAPFLHTSAESLHKAAIKFRDEQNAPTIKPPFDLAKAHTLILEGKAPPLVWVPFITELSFVGKKELTDISALSGLVDLKKLDLRSTQVKNIAPLGGLRNLISLILRETEIHDLSPLTGLAHLEALDLSGTKVKSVSALNGLPALSNLELSNTKIGDVSPLNNLPCLQKLDLGTTQVNDVKALSALVSLRELSLSDTRVSDISPLEALVKLEKLTLSMTEVTDLSPVKNMTSLKYLALSQTKIKDFDCIKHLNNIETIYLEGTVIDDVNCLATLVRLKSLYLSETKVSDVSPLSDLTHLVRLELRGTKVSDVSGLAGIKKLRLLDLRRTQIGATVYLKDSIARGLVIQR
jgi:Leucine-rich repeat (LRR) protein